jgi:CIC family chloride channel protein
LDIGSRDLVVCFPDESVFVALNRMLRSNIGRLPVVSREDPLHMIGYLGRTSVMSSWGRHLEDESLREQGWIDRFRQDSTRSLTEK